MPREAEVSQNERDFVLRALNEGIRLDNRAFDAFRPLIVSFGDEYGVADVKLGKTQCAFISISFDSQRLTSTSVLARISAEVTAPFPDRKFDGIFTISTELSAMASPAFESGRAPSEQETLLSRLLEKAIRRSNALDTESLCIISGQKVWSVRADVHVLSLDGGLVDAACIAVVAALQHFRRPDVSVHGEKVRLFSMDEREPVGLSMLHIPYCVTFSLVGAEGGIVLVDANALEGRIGGGEVVVTANKMGEICQIAKLGGVAVDAVELLKCTEQAVQLVGGLHTVVEQALKEDAQKRDKGGLARELRAENDR